MPEQGSDHAGVGDERDAVAAQARDTVERACLQNCCGLSARSDEVQRVGRPGVEQLAVDVLPGDTLPIAEVDFQQAPIERGLSMQGLGQAARTSQGTRHYRDVGRQQGAQALGNWQWIFRIDVELAIAKAFSQQWPRMADQEKLHNMPK